MKGFKEKAIEIIPDLLENLRPHVDSDSGFNSDQSAFYYILHTNGTLFSRKETDYNGYRKQPQSSHAQRRSLLNMRGCLVCDGESFPERFNQQSPVHRRSRYRRREDFTKSRMEHALFLNFRVHERAVYSRCCNRSITNFSNCPRIPTVLAPWLEVM